MERPKFKPNLGYKMFCKVDNHKTKNSVIVQYLDRSKTNVLRGQELSRSGLG
jgi:hypothetical protein